ncbi:MAG: helix-turn-helix domain-containing protein, partial [Ignavibacteriae bacterium]|nr:helix-turn-helix domain-containing protein [Ignavibacteriota bacterium]
MHLQSFACSLVHHPRYIYTPIATEKEQVYCEHGEMTQAALAEKIGMTRQTVAAIEAGKY